MSPTRELSAGGMGNHDLTALVVDDDAFVRMVAVKALRRLDVGTVYEAANGSEAIDVLSAGGRDVDLILCDLQMPDVDGIQTLEALAKLGTRAGIVIQSTYQEQALNAASEFARSHSLNLLGTWEKPLKKEALAEIVHMVANGRQMDSMGAVAPLPVAEVSANELAGAIRDGQLVMHYQPKIRIGDRAPTGVEALVRWNHPGHGLLAPVAFVPLAEREGLIGELTTAVMIMALRECAPLIHDGLLDTVAVNLSVVALNDISLTDHTVNLIQRRGLKPENIILEVTESAVIEDMQSAMHILSRLHLKGIKLSIDDFGTGYSSLQKLLRVPFDELKIDKSFVSEAHNNEVQRTILESTIQLAHRLDMGTVAEGVETEHDWEMLKKLGAAAAQGFFVKRPAPMAEIAGWLTGSDLGTA